MATTFSQLEVYDHHENLHWLRGSALRRLLVAGALVAIVVLMYLGLEGEDPPALPIYLLSVLIPFVLLLLVLAAYLLSRRIGTGTATAVYIAGLIGIIFLAVIAFSQPLLLFLLIFPVGIAGLIFHVRGGALAAVATSLLLFAQPYLQLMPPAPPALITLTVICLWMMVGFLWVAMHPMDTTLHWAWMSYESSRRKQAEVQEHRAKLMQAVKEVQSANQRLSAMAFELDRARRAANDARRLKAEFAANISHELRTPLNLIIGFSEMMALAPHTYGNEPLPAAYRGDVQAIYRNAKHLSTLIDDVLDLSQIEAGRMGLLRTPLWLHEVIDEAINTVASLYENKGLWIKTVAPDAPVYVEADRTRIRQVLINLLSNACRYTKQGGVTIETQVDESDVTVHVRDTGVGIRAEDLPLVFQQFSQLEGAAPGELYGSGLGLSICRDFVELHGGRMTVESTPGQGTTFTFTLPLREELRLSRLPPNWETWAMFTSQRDQQTVAILSSDPATISLFERYLDDYRVVPVHSVEEAWHLAERCAIHALVVVAGSGEVGWLALRHVRETLPKLPILVCTLRGGTAASRPIGATHYLMKPVSQEQFLAALEQLGDHVQRLLIVDDNPEVVRLLSRMVASAPRNYDIHRAFTGDSALELLRAQPIDAVVLDLLMPETDGYDVLSQMRKDAQLAAIPVIIVTAKGQEEETITAGLVGISQQDGFPVGSMMRCLRANLNAIRSPTGIYTEPHTPAVPAD